MTFAYGLGAALLALLLWLGLGIRRIGAVSHGAPIGARDGSALLLIDLQTVFWDHGPYPEAARTAAEEAILSEVAAARAGGHPVIALRQEWSIPSTTIIARLAMKGQAIAGSAGTELARPFEPLPDHTLVKRVQDGFETGELDALLDQLNVGKLTIAGLDLNYCVQKTARAARQRGFDVTVRKAGTLAAAPTEATENQLRDAGVRIA